MATYDSNHVKNIALLGHPGSGKTTLAESMLFESGLIKRRGSVIAKNTVSDYHELETERQSSVFSSLMHTVWRDYKINIIDTPGYDDFSGELISALRVADTGLLILNAAVGVEVGTDVIWEYTDNFKTPTVFVVNQIDKEAADFDKTLQEAKNHFLSFTSQENPKLYQATLLAWDVDLKSRAINPGTSADLTVATILAMHLLLG